MSITRILSTFFCILVLAACQKDEHQNTQAPLAQAEAQPALDTNKTIDTNDTIDTHKTNVTNNANTTSTANSETVTNKAGYTAISDSPKHTSLKQTSSESTNDKSDATYPTIEWTDLIPQEDLDALLNPPDYLDEIEDGSPSDTLSGQITAGKPQIPNDIEAGIDVSMNESRLQEERYQQALVSTTVKPEFNNRKLRISGFIVPLEFNEAQVITTFFFVPYFGACLHMPPPPPNQIIYAEYERGIQLEALYAPFSIEGTLSTTLIENDMATAAYAMTVSNIVPYEGE